MRHCGLISGFIQQAPKEPYITQRLLICRGIRQKMMVWRSLQDPGDTGKSSSRRQTDAHLHVKAVFTRTHTQSVQMDCIVEMHMVTKWTHLSKAIKGL